MASLDKVAQKQAGIDKINATLLKMFIITYGQDLGQAYFHYVLDDPADTAEEMRLEAIFSEELALCFGSDSNKEKVKGIRALLSAQNVRIARLNQRIAALESRSTPVG